MNQGTCNKCHLVRGEGKQIGPDLTEIGSKLSREAMFESILYPVPESATVMKPSRPNWPMAMW